jgi:hypothetical protein
VIAATFTGVEIPAAFAMSIAFEFLKGGKETPSAPVIEPEISLFLFPPPPPPPFVTVFSDCVTLVVGVVDEAEDMLAETVLIISGARLNKSRE